MAKKRVVRRRRTAEEAREEILDAAERRLAEVGPDGLRLQEIAADVGVSHPAVLHHFGSREGLVEAVVERAVRVLEADLVEALGPGPGPPEPERLLGRVFTTLADRGHARLLAWLVLSGHARSTPESRANWRRIVDATHVLRLEADPSASWEDTAFTVVLSSFALFGAALAGDVTFENAGLGRAARERFRPWLGALLLSHLAGEPVPR